ncbi:NAD(P)-dependent dehydrogenase (short-subunit alcohol dehydrogenase family) [Gracilibacillus halotolerans]|uniref:NAD(P)-dependent dehydrogenase (Short-subunit alcohol dehydrogenase family) n=1 Tax=Gracilibacillus halotolerans TaxID=74386 RepID=A0A841RKD5_9BACI|nr:SDR family oxidoreductase [Gracilibacillus halotolerans]MBB6512093.1 NAD(P)-dependent dehydrogenase (short-subunit alcohol dehydrogenase family) [Gracilibacillus halotolerans]
MKIALVTGAGSGFGYLTALTLLEQGIHVIATMRTLQTADNLRKDAENKKIAERLTILQMDVTNSEQIENVRNYIDKEFKRLDVLVNNAGFCQGGFVSDLTYSNWKMQMDVNVDGTFQVTKQLIPLLERSEKAHIINISSVSGLIGLPGMSAYCSSKFALEGFSESLRIELLPKNIYVSLVEPGSYQTKIWEKGLAGIEPTDMEEDALKESVLRYARRAADGGANPQEVADLVAKISRLKKPKLRYPIGKGTKALYYAKKLVPWSLVERVVMKQL